MTREKRGRREGSERSETEPDGTQRSRLAPGKRTLTGAQPGQPSRRRAGSGIAPGRSTLTGKLAMQRKRKRHDRPASPDAVRDAGDIAARGTADSGAPLPYEERVQRAFGRHDISDVRAHTGASAAEASEALGADAYAVGGDVAFKDAPDLHTSAHEAAHVIQQREGVSLKGGVGQQGDAYERHADAVADAVVAGNSAEPLLDAIPGSGGTEGVQLRDADGSGGAGLGGGDAELAGDAEGGEMDPELRAQAAASHRGQAPSLDREPLPDDLGKAEAGSRAQPAPSSSRGDASAAAPRAPARQGRSRRSEQAGQAAFAGDEQADTMAPTTKADAPAPPPRTDAPNSPASLGLGPMPEDSVPTDWSGAAGAAGLVVGAAAGSVAGPVGSAAAGAGAAKLASSAAGPEPAGEAVRAMQDGYRAVQNELAHLSRDVQSAFDAVMARRDAQSGAIDAAIATRVGVLRQLEATGVAAVGGAFAQAEAGLGAEAQAARGTIQARESEVAGGAAQAQQGQRRDVAGSFGAAQQSVDGLVETETGPLEAFVRSFADQVEALGREKKAAAIEEGNRGAAQHDPAAHDGNVSADEGYRSLEEDAARQANEKAGKEAGTRIEELTTGIAEGIRQQAEPVARRILEPFAAQLGQERTVTETAASDNVDAAGDDTQGSLEVAGQTARAAVDHAEAAGARQLGQQRQDAESRFQCEGESLVAECEAAGEWLKIQLERAANGGAAACIDILERVRAEVQAVDDRAESQTIVDYEAALTPVLEQARAQLPQTRESSIEGIDELCERGLGELDTSLGEQEAGYAEAMQEQGRLLEEARARAREEMGLGLAAVNESMSGIADSSSDAMRSAIDQGTARIADFQAQTDESLEQTKQRLSEQLMATVAEASIQVDVLIAGIPGKAAQETQQTIAKQRAEVPSQVATLNKAMDRWGTDEGAIHATFRPLTYGQIEALEGEYNDHYPEHGNDSGLRPLRYDLQDEMSGKDLRIAIAYLNHDRDTALRLELEQATGFWNDDEARIEAVCRAASDEEIERLNRDAAPVIAEVKASLGGGDLDVVNTLLDTQIPREQRVARADAIRLFEAVRNPHNVDEAKVEQLLEQAGSPEERALLRAEFNKYGDEKLSEPERNWLSIDDARNGAQSDLLGEMLDAGFHGAKQAEMLELAKEERDDRSVAMARLLVAGEGGGTKERDAFAALDDAELAGLVRELEEAQKEGDSERVRALSEQINELRQSRRDAFGRMAEQSGRDDKSMEAFLDAEMGREGFVTYDDLRSGKYVYKNLPDVLQRDANLERMVAQRKLERGYAEPDLLLAYACYQVGTDEELIKQALSDGGAPRSKAEIQRICEDFKTIWGDTLAAFSELERNAGAEDFNDFEEPGGLLADELGGDDWLDVRVLLCGKPETPQEVRYIAKLRAHHAQSGILGGAIMEVAEATGFTSAKSDLEAQERRFDEFYEQHFAGRETVKLDELGVEGDRLETLARYIKDDAEAYQKTLASITNTLVTALEIVAGVVAAAVLPGVGWAILAGIVIGASGIAIRKAALGDAYGGEDIARDLAIAVGAAVLSELKALGKAVKQGDALFPVLREGAEAAATTVTREGIETGAETAARYGGRLSGAGARETGEATARETLEAGTRESVEEAAEAGAGAGAREAAEEAGKAGGRATAGEIAKKAAEEGLDGVQTALLTDIWTFLTSEETYEKKFDEALGSLLVSVVKNLPKNFVSGAFTSAIGEVAGKREGMPGSAIQKAVTSVGANTLGTLVYVDSYDDAAEFWKNLLTSNVQAVAKGAFSGAMGHTFRPRKLALDVVTGKETRESLEKATYLDDSEKRAIVEFVRSSGKPEALAELPDSFLALSPTRSADE